MKAMRKIRQFRKMTLDDVFLKTGISIPKLSRIEREIFQPTQKEKKLISRALQMPIKKVFPKERKKILKTSVEMVR